MDTRDTPIEAGSEHRGREGRVSQVGIVKTDVAAVRHRGGLADMTRGHRVNKIEEGGGDKQRERSGVNLVGD